jgi:hypothetical protein
LVYLNFYKQTGKQCDRKAVIIEVSRVRVRGSGCDSNAVDTIDRGFAFGCPVAYLSEEIENRTCRRERDSEKIEI